MRPGSQRVTLGGFGSGRPVPTDVWVLLGVVFATFSLQFFQATAWLVSFLRLGPLVWEYGLVWQLATYPFAGIGGASLWILLELLILFWFARDVFHRLGRRNFWKLLLWAAVGAAVLAVLVELASRGLGGGHPQPFLLMQGQRMLLTVVIAAFAVLYRHSTILLFFVLPVQARWFLWIEILFAFIGFLGTHDLAGFLGVCAAVGITWSLLTTGSLRRGLREAWLRLQERWLRWKLGRSRRQRDFRVIEGEKDSSRGGGRGGSSGDGPGSWVH